MTAVVELAPTHKLLPRWSGHGDLHIVIETDRVFVRSDQAEQLAGIPPWGRGETLLDDHWFEHNGNQYYPLEDAIARCETEETALAASFLAWLNETLEQLLNEDVLDMAQGVPSFIGSYPVDRAASILDRDPAISIGRTSLFAHMHLEGWLTRRDDWEISTVARRNGWLTTRNVTVPAPTRSGRRAYPQIYVTPAGLTELRRTLHALNSSPPPDDDHPSLF